MDAKPDQDTNSCAFQRRRSVARGLLITTVLTAALAVAPIVSAQVNVTMQQNDMGRTGQNLNETVLTLANVNSAQFGLLFSQPVSGQVFAQPLYLSGVTINGIVHNVVFVTTLTDIVYAFDANSNAGANASPLWTASLLDSLHGAAPGATLYPNLGAMGTPVIDPIGNTLYVFGPTYEGGAPVFRLHALDVTTGAERSGSPVTITASVPGSAADGNGTTVPMTMRNHMVRTGMLLLNGVVYIGFGSQSEPYSTTWHGWVVGYDAVSLAQTGVFCTTPNGQGASIWTPGTGLAADVLDPVNHPFGRLFFVTGNGDFNATTPYTNNMDYGDSVVNLDLTNGIPTVTDDFTPYNQAVFYAKDLDQGSGGALLLPTQTTGAYPNLLVQAGKFGTLYLLNRDNLGGYNGTTDQVVQALVNAVGTPGLWGAPAYWNGNVYFWGKGDYLKAFPLVNGLLSNTPTLSTETANFPGPSPSVSANGNSQGIIWDVNVDAFASGGPAILQAHDASNVATTLYSSATNAARDSAGPAVQFAVPTIANGMVYVGTVGQIDAYGLLNNAQTMTPSISPGSGTFSGSISVTITDASPNAAIYYTTDGSAATTGSTLYTGTITVSSSETINAVAVAPGLAMSSQAWKVYSLRQTAPPTFPTAAVSYSSPQQITISDSTSNAAIYYTTDGSNPTLGSTPYSGPITVSASETIKAIALAPGYSISTIGSASYAIVSSSTILINEPAGFGSTAGFSLDGGATLTNNALQLSGTGNGITASAVWYATPVNVQTFTTDFYFSIQEPSHNFADGITFTLQNSAAGTGALGGVGGGLGYQGIGSSVAVKFDVFNNAGEGNLSTGFYSNGAAPTVPAVDIHPLFYLPGPNIIHANLAYDGTTLTLTMTDTVTGAHFTTSTAINIPAIVGANTAYAGFTGGAHGPGATQTIWNWTYVGSPGAASVTATPTFTPAAGTYRVAQPVMINDATSAAVIYYTTDGSTPTTSSAVYSGAISVTANKTLKAIGLASGYTKSAVAAASYNIRAATPTFTPGAGTYPAAKSVTINDATSGAVIHYTTDGSTPAASSAVYSGAISVTANETLEAIALASGYATSTVATAAYAVRTATPTFTPVAGTYAIGQPVTINDASSGAVIYYTTDDSTPTTSSAVYSSAITLTANENVKALALASGYATSTVATAAYTIRTATPTFTPVAGTYAPGQTVTINDATSGAVIHYTTDGSTPTASSAVYSAAITLTANEKVKALAIASGYAKSSVGTAAYKVH